MEDIKWIFSGVGIFILTLIIGVVKYFINRKKRNEHNKNNRTVNQYGDKSLYIEENEGDITIN